jgi:hypothetical protein
MSQTYVHTPEMGEISGFGGGYEAICQKMLDAGVRYLLHDRPDLDPRFRGNSAIFGVILEDNDAAKALSKVVIDASGGDCTGAMHHAVVSRCLWIKRNGWDAYVQESSKQKED